MNGFELTEKIKKIGPEIPVILCTGLSENTETEGEDPPKISGIITKPVSRKEMGDAIRRILDEKEKTAIV